MQRLYALLHLCDEIAGVGRLHLDQCCTTIGISARRTTQFPVVHPAPSNYPCFLLFETRLAFNYWKCQPTIISSCFVPEKRQRRFLFSLNNPREAFGECRTPPSPPHERRAVVATASNVSQGLSFDLLYEYTLIGT